MVGQPEGLGFGETEGRGLQGGPPGEEEATQHGDQHRGDQGIAACQVAKSRAATVGLPWVQILPSTH